MINPQLLDYVRAQRASGLSKEAITQALAQGGWTAQDVSEAFMAIDGVQTPPPPPPPAPASAMAPAAAPVTAASVSTNPAPVGPRVITPPPGAAQPSVPPLQPLGAQFGSMTTTPVQPRPVMAASEMSTARVAQKKGRGMLWIILLVVVLLLAGAGALIYFQLGFFMDLIGMSLPEPTPAYVETAPVPGPDADAPIEILPTETASSTASTTPTTTASTTVGAETTASTTAH
jgi:hypothetical protein